MRVLLDEYMPRRLRSLPYGVEVLMVGNRLGNLVPLVPGILAALRSLKPGNVVRIGS
jgi:hypothetical protein